MAGEGKNKAAINMEEDCENWCFVCKDGGDLRICDFRQCVKSYHPECVRKKDSFLKSVKAWNCPWHKCFLCNRSSYLRCYTCSKATCSRCLSATRILKVKGAYGFCKNCLKLALLIEENKECDSDGEYVDFTDRDTAEGLFMEYYTFVKNNEGFKLEDIYAAKECISVKKNDPPKRVLEHFDQDSDTVFIGWASRSLIEFLDSIGKSTTGKLSKDEVTAIVRDYAEKNKLLHPVKRQLVKCDVQLQSLFGKGIINISKVYDLLEDHFAEARKEEKEADNNEGFKRKDLPKCALVDLDQESDCREVRVEKGKTGKRRRRSNGHEKLGRLNKKVLVEGDKVGYVPEPSNDQAVERQRKEGKNEEKEAVNDEKEAVKDEKEAVNEGVPTESRLASIVVDNMKLLYLRRSVLNEMLKEPESFEEKAVGCFVQLRKSYELVRIKGVKTLSQDEKETVLLLSEEPTEIQISLLADTDPDDVSSRGEFNALMGKFLAGEIERPTVAYVQQKASSLHKDTINVMISKQLVTLRYRVEQAREKGLRNTLPQYERDIMTLESKTEYARLLQNVPTVIPDMSEPEGMKDCSKGDEQNNNRSEEDVEVRAPESEGGKIEVIEDEVENEAVNPEHEMWCLQGPAGERNEVPLFIMRKWSAVSAYSSKFVVWKIDEREEDAIPLPEALGK